MTREQNLSLSQRAVSFVFPPTGQHRRVPGQLVEQRFVDCLECGVSTAATVHGDVTLCTEGHEQPAGGAV